MYVDQSRRFSDSYCLQRVINKGTQATVWEATSLSIDDDNVEIEYLLFHAVTGYSVTEMKGVVDYANLLES